MAIYTVHRSAGAPGEPVFVKDGFSVPAFLFTLVWLLFKRMWIVALVVIAYLLATSIIASAGGREDFWQFLFSFVLALILGLEGNDLLRWSLARRGYREVALVEAQDVEEAELKYFIGDDAATIVAAPQEPRPMPADPLATDALGLFGKP